MSDWDMEAAIRERIAEARQEVLPGTMEYLTNTWLPEQQRKRVCGVDYLPTHLRTWNSCCRDGGASQGLAVGWHVIVAGNPGSGKSMMALNLAARFSTSPARVGFLSLEMSERQLMTRWLAIRSGKPIRKLESGSYFDESVAMEAFKLGAITSDEMLLVDESRAMRKLDAAMAKLAEWRESGVSVFVIDYMQLLTSHKARDLREETMDVSAALADFAKDNRVVTVGLSQFNRETARNYDTKPTIQGLYGGMPMEGDADQVVMLDHSRYERMDLSDGARTWVLLGKNRHGPITDIPVYIDYGTLRMTEALPDEEHLWPGAQK